MGFNKGPFDPATLLLGCIPDTYDASLYSTLPNGLFSLLLILWKFTILSLTQVDADNIKYSHDKVWRLTLTRYVERCNALHYSHQSRIRQAETRETTPPNPSKLTKALAPLAKVDSRGQFHYGIMIYENLCISL